MIQDLTNYNLLKTKKLVSLKRIDVENLAIATKQFSSVDGSELSTQVQGITLTEVNKAIADKQAEIATLNAFKADLVVVV